MKIERRSIIIVASAVMALVVVLILMFKNYHPRSAVKPGQTVPNVRTTTVAGTSFELDSLRGEPVFLNFFAPWCPPCIEETPDLITFAKKHGEKVHVVMVDRGDSKALVVQYIKKYHLPDSITVLLDPNNSWTPVFGITGQPETLFITSHGKLVKHVIGPLTLQQMETDMKLAE
ncbi:TlpA disulfide reductase family protein [Alicyclobacillus sp. SO9]|uniref:TlpA family protein disulfide reductase n=1 Tax=Alicyclobacillus sp. SO9 TaxID=2665646 RepID=UPI0018E907D0|nr:TlpA disulfide reductase family protein [Alicyclobacillus sp. SO9]QQE78456.1 redoxin family protein [Alicyclobacillus sp. SO9]